MSLVAERNAARSTISEQEKKIAELEAERDALKQQAQIQAGEMRAHKSSLHEAYQYITGATGEPGNWNGARPIKEAVDKLRNDLTSERQRREKAEAVLRTFAVLEYNWQDRCALATNHFRKYEPGK